MTGPYDDILALPRPVSSHRKRMPLEDRAAQFAPFAALSGFEEIITAEVQKANNRDSASAQQESDWQSL